jgi:hypothetical protein
MPNPKGNPDFKSKYGEPTKVVRLPQSIADDIVTLLRVGNSTDDVLKELSSVTLLHKKLLPEVSAVYLVYQQTPVGNKLLYVGRAKNLRSRWMTHDRFKQLAGIENTHIAWFECDLESQPVIESTLIDCLEPEFNNTAIELSSIQSRRLTAYITPENWQWLQKYAVEKGFCDDDGKINQSPLVNSILNSFLTGSAPSITPAVDNSTLSDVLEDVKAELRDAIIGEVNSLMTNYQEEISKKLTA